MIEPAKLYRLSLSTGVSLDLTASCERFLRELMDIRTMATATVWLEQRHMVDQEQPDGAPEPAMVVQVHAFPAGRTGAQAVPLGHSLLVRLAERGSLNVMLPDPDMVPFVGEAAQRDGSVSLIRLRHLGFLLLRTTTSRPPFHQAELLDLKGPLEGFASWIEGCLAHQAVEREVARRKRVEAELRRREEHFRSLIENAGDVILLLDYDTSIRFASPSVERVLGKPPSEVEGQNLLSLAHPDDVSFLMRLFRGRLLQDGVGPTLDLRLGHVDGDWRVLETHTTSLLGLPAVAGIVLNCRDVTESRAVRAALEASEERFALAVRGSHDAIWDWDLATDRIYFSERWREMVGADEVPDRPEAWLALVHPEDRNDLENAIAAHARGDAEQIDCEYRLRHSCGDWRWVLCRGVGVRNGNGTAVRLAGSQTDISNDKRKQAELEEARQVALAASRARGEFLANMSHEIRTPMNGILGMVSVLLETSLSAEQRECAETIRTSGRALLSIVNDVLDFSKIESGRIELEELIFDPRQPIEDALDSFSHAAAEKGLDVLYRADPATPTAVGGDMVKLRQILLNLVGNAVKFTEQGEVLVSLTAGLPTAGRLELRFEVRDTGIGISSTAMGTLFEPFLQADASTTRRFGGTGLGLSISRRLCEAMGGEISVSSVEGEGSTFTFTVQVDATADADAPILPDLGGRRVLVAHPKPSALDMLTELVASWGGDVVAASSLEAARTAVGAGSAPHAAVLGFAGADLESLLDAVAARGPRRRFPVIVLRPIGAAAGVDGAATSAIVHSSLSEPVKQRRLAAALAAATGAAAPAVPSEPPPLAAGADDHAPLRILLAEDNPVNQRVTALMLERLGYRADVVANGEDALAALARQPYDLVVMDLRMPVMDGVEATVRLRSSADLVQPYVVALTAQTLHGDTERLLRLGINHVLTKPLQIDDLRATLRRVLGERSSGHHPAVVPIPLADEPPTLDESVLDGIAELSRPGFVAAIIEEFLVSASSDLAHIERTLAAGEAASVADGAHHLLGSCLGLGARRMASVCAELEACAREEDLGQAPDLLAGLVDELDTVRSILLLRSGREAAS